MNWLIIGGIGVVVVGLYIGNSYYQAYQRREALKRSKQAEIKARDDNNVSKSDDEG